MDSRPRLDGLVAALRADVSSGAAELAEAAAEALGSLARSARGEEVSDVEDALAELSEAILDAQPSMAPLVSLARSVLAATGASGSAADAREAAVEAAEAFVGSLRSAREEVARRVAETLGDGPVLTLSRSSTVERALTIWGRAGNRRVLCLESRPGREGRILAERLARAGGRVTYAVDAAAAPLLPSCEALLIGADSIGDAGVVNKIGSRAAAREAMALGVPVCVAADSSKILPPGFPQPLADARPGSEVWDAPEGVEVWNRYFELVPLDLVNGVVTESGALTPAELESLRSGLETHRRLRSWADRKRAST